MGSTKEKLKTKALGFQPVFLDFFVCFLFDFWFPKISHVSFTPLVVVVVGVLVEMTIPDAPTSKTTGSVCILSPV
jgi:hypothetical protein